MTKSSPHSSAWACRVVYVVCVVELSGIPRSPIYLILTPLKVVVVNGLVACQERKKWWQTSDDDDDDDGQLTILTMEWRFAAMTLTSNIWSWYWSTLNTPFLYFFCSLAQRLRIFILQSDKDINGKWSTYLNKSEWVSSTSTCNRDHHQRWWESRSSDKQILIR